MEEISERERRRRKYRKLRSHLRGIQTELSDLQMDFDSLIGFMKKSLLIDNQLVDEEILSRIENTTNDVQNELSNTVIPMVSNKC